ncbi:MAG: hypothetical protein HY505_02305 [Candidatus Yanofskybacteria bacterium]|nr:hypothetical protein [Candidatus Yanofskybacteria bacterium]
MPYVEKDDRAMLDPYIDRLSDVVAERANQDKTLRGLLKFAGFLNYIFTRTTLKVLKSLFGKFSYWMFALIIGVLITMIFEIYRRVVAPYEDGKIKENGDVDVFEEFTGKKES